MDNLVAEIYLNEKSTKNFLINLLSRYNISMDDLTKTFNATNKFVDSVIEGNIDEALKIIDIYDGINFENDIHFQGKNSRYGEEDYFSFEIQEDDLEDGLAHMCSFKDKSLEITKLFNYILQNTDLSIVFKKCYKVAIKNDAKEIIQTLYKKHKADLYQIVNLENFKLLHECTGYLDNMLPLYNIHYHHTGFSYEVISYYYNIKPDRFYNSELERTIKMLSPPGSIITDDRKKVIEFLEELDTDWCIKSATKLT